MSKSTQKTYERLIKKTMEAIRKVPPDDRAEFDRLNAKANRYLKKYEGLR